MRGTRSFHILTFLCFLLPVIALPDVTIYNTAGVEPTHAPPPGIYSGLQAFNPVELAPPPVPTPLPATKFNVPLPAGNSPGLSIKQSGAFMGLSIEFAVFTVIVGKNSSLLQVPFLNLMSNLQQRAGHVNIRLGGTSLDHAVLVDSLGSPETEAVLYGTASRPPLVFTPGLMYTMSNVSALLNVRWIMGIPFNETNPFHTRVAEDGLAILGDNLIGLQVGDQPDQYATAGLRPYNYSPNDYMDEFGRLIDFMNNGTSDSTDSEDPALNSTSLLSRASKLLIGPNIITGSWTPEMVWWTGFPYRYRNNLASLAVAHYPSNNCFGKEGQGPNISAQDIFPSFLNHSATVDLVRPYRYSAQVAQEIGKPLLMIETNSASCGGFPGLSDSFGSALWALDYSLQMAYCNFSGALFHVNGPNSSYNAFTAPSSLDLISHGWTVGPIYYSTLVMAETLGSSNESQVIDLAANDGNVYTPAYGIYERGVATKVALFNFITDPSGASNYVASISSAVLGGLHNAIPPSVSVKYLLASSVSRKDNITWAGQTFGGVYESDGLLKGTEDVRAVPCPDGVCRITVPAPGFALVFLQRPGLGGGGMDGDAPTMTFSTTVSPGELVSATLDPEVLATSNGRKRIKGHFGSTTRGKVFVSSERDGRPGRREVVVGAMAVVVMGAVWGAWGPWGGVR